MIEALLPFLFLFPGVLLPRGRRETVSAWLAARFLVSVGANGLLFSLLRAAGVYRPAVVTPWLIAAAIVVFTMAGRGAWRRARRPRSLGPRLRRSAPVLVLGALVVGQGAYWSLLFPPVLWDSTYYHLPFAHIYASPELHAFYTAGEHRFAWLLEGVSSGNVIEIFLSVFWLYGSPLYRLAPPCFAAAFLATVLALGRCLGLGRTERAVAALLTAATPAVLAQAGDYYVDLALAAYLTAAVVVLHRAVSATRRSPSGRDVLLAGVLLGLACWVKKSGVLGLAFPAVIAATAFHRHRRPFVTAAVVTALATAVAGEYLLRIPGFPSYPGLGQAAEPIAYARELLTVGLPGLFWRSTYLNAGVLAAALVLLGLRFARRDRLPVTAPEAALLALSGLWLAWALAGIYHYGRLDYFNQWGRFLFPAYPFLCVLAVRHARLHRIGVPRSASRPAGWKPGRAVAVAVLALVLLLTPWRRLARFGVWRGRAASGRPFLSAEAKQAAVYGAWHRTVTYVNELYRKAGGGRVLTEDVRIHHLEPCAYEAFGVPADVRSVPAFLRWARAEDVRWVIRGLRRLDFARSDRWRGTAIHAFLRSPHARPVIRIGSFQIFAVEPRVVP
jgi:hypothetical protein